MSDRRGSKPAVICFRDAGAHLIQDLWYNQRSLNEEEEKMRIVKLAAKIVRDDIRAQVYNYEEYPPPGDFLKDTASPIPATLKCFMEGTLCYNTFNCVYFYFSQR